MTNRYRIIRLAIIMFTLLMAWALYLDAAMPREMPMDVDYGQVQESCEDIGMKTIPSDDPRYGGECY